MMFSAKKSITLAAALFCLVSFDAFAGYVYWNNEGTGGWQAGSQWIGGVKPAPGDVAMFTNVTVTVTDDDFEYVAGTLEEVRCIKDATLLFAMTNDVTTPLRLHMTDPSCRIVKTGTNTFELGSSAWVKGEGTLTVSNGTLKIDGVHSRMLQDQEWFVMEVFSPGVVSLPTNASFYVKGLVGDGTVTRADDPSKTTYQFIFMGDTNGTEYAFSGLLETNISLTAGQSGSSYLTYKCRQAFTGISNGYAPGHRLYNGMLGAVKFGDMVSPSSIGYNQVASPITFVGTLYGSETGVFYAGTGGEKALFTFRLDNLQGNSARFVVDGGAHGGIEFANDWWNRSKSSYNGQMMRMFLRGDAGTCVLSGKVYSSNPTSDVMFVKQGIGTWRFTDDKVHGNRGPVFVEKGTLEYTSIAETNMPCSIGVANMITTNFNGTATDVLPYVHKLGDGSLDTSATGLATFSYVGTDRVDIATRPIALDGAGRILNATNLPFSWSGFSALPSGGTLVLDGGTSNSGGVVRDLQDGEGPLSVEKRGAGSWRVSGTNGFSGDLVVSKGTLVIDGSRAGYNWFRFTILDMMDKPGAFPKIQEFALYDAQGIRRNAGMIQNRTIDTISEGSSVTAITVDAPDNLPPNTITYGISGYYRDGIGSNNTFETDDRDLGNICDDSKASPRSAGWYPTRVPNNNKHCPDGTTANAIPIVMRLADDVTGIAAFDICTSSSIMTNYVVKNWTIEGSFDGRSWDMLTNMTFTTDVSQLTYDNRNYHSHKWYSRHEQSKWGDAFVSGRVLTAADPGFPLRGHSLAERPNPLRNVSSVRVAPGARLVANGEVELKSLVGNPATGTGTIDGFSFAPVGTLVVESEALGKTALDLSFNITNCTSFANIAGWGVATADGRLRRRLSIRITGDGKVSIPACGFTISIR